MSQLGDVLEILFGPSEPFETVRATIHHEHDDAAAKEASRADKMLYGRRKLREDGRGSSGRDVESLAQAAPRRRHRFSASIWFGAFSQRRSRSPTETGAGSVTRRQSCRYETFILSGKRSRPKVALRTTSAFPTPAKEPGCESWNSSNKARSLQIISDLERAKLIDFAHSFPQLPLSAHQMKTPQVAGSILPPRPAAAKPMRLDILNYRAGDARETRRISVFIAGSRSLILTCAYFVSAVSLFVEEESRYF